MNAGPHANFVERAFKEHPDAPAIGVAAQFMADADGIEEDWNALHNAIPKTLYHYTTAAGYHGILNDEYFRASHIEYLNDSSELSYASDLIAQVVESVLTEERYEALVARFRNWRATGSVFFNERDPFVVCFCEDGDLLSQWRAYARGSAGAALGFDLQPAIGPRPYSPLLMLRKVVYDPSLQEEILTKTVATWKASAEGLLFGPRQCSESDVLGPLGVSTLMYLLSEPRICFKNPGFSEEHEWRLVKLVDARAEFQLPKVMKAQDLFEQVQAERAESQLAPLDSSTAPIAESSAEGVRIGFRASEMGLVPYVELSLVDELNLPAHRMPLTTVVQGPSAHPELARRALLLFLASKGYDDASTQLVASSVPLRV